MSDNVINGDMKAMKDLMDMFQPQDLHEDLVLYKTKVGPFDAIKHPLVYSLPHSDNQNKMVNERYLKVKQRLERAEKEKDYHTCVWLHERPHRVDAFCKYRNFFSSKEYWSILGAIWTDTENAWQSYNIWLMLWSRNIPDSFECMDEEEKEIFLNLPDYVQAWRGCMFRNRHGMSWTLNLEKARFFANRYGNDKPLIYEAVIPKSSILAYFNGRNESEIVVKPKTFKMKKL
jgi:hypothetical protein